jgi:hypothetical protein
MTCLDGGKAWAQQIGRPIGEAWDPDRISGQPVAEVQAKTAGLELRR